MFLFFERVKLLCFVCLVDYAHISNAGHGGGAHGAIESCSKDVKVTILSPPLILGEEPFYCKETDSVYFVDIIASQVYRYSLRSGKIYFAQIGLETVSVIIPIKGIPGAFLITFGKKLCILCWNGKSRQARFKCFSQPDPDHPYPVFFLDDAKAYPGGSRLFFYSAPSPFVTFIRNESSLFSVVDGKQKTLLTNFGFGNGLGWARRKKPFGRDMYFSDTFRAKAYVAFYNEKTNSVENVRVLVNYADLGLPGRVDSLTVDRKGYVWLAVNGPRGYLLKVDPVSGRVKCLVELPASGVTNLAFARCLHAKNDDLDCIYVTTSTLVANQEQRTPYDGTLLLVQFVGSSGHEGDKLEPGAIFNRSGTREYREFFSCKHCPGQF